MSTFHPTIEIGDFARNRFETLDAFVDTGATYRFIPADVLQRLGIVAVDERVFLLGNGQRATCGMAWIRLRIEGREQPTPATFAKAGSEPLLGFIMLEESGPAVDRLNERLVSLPGHLVGLREELDGPMQPAAPPPARTDEGA